jgi:large subunit ribosomal protein L6
MSKIGKQPIKLPKEVTVEINDRSVVVSGPRGSLVRSLPRGIGVVEKDGELLVAPKKDSPSISAVYGTTRALIANMVTGVSTGWKKVLELVGAGYKAEVSGKTLILTVGFSHPVKIEAPEGITFKVEKTLITVDGQDKETVGQISATVRAVRPPEPYKGKGIKYQDEVVRRKAGKAAKTIGVTA